MDVFVVVDKDRVRIGNTERSVVTDDFVDDLWYLIESIKSSIGRDELIFKLKDDVFTIDYIYYKITLVNLDNDNLNVSVYFTKDSKDRVYVSTTKRLFIQHLDDVIRQLKSFQ